MHSQFLPDSYDNEAIVLIAGKGRYPELLSESIRQHPIDLKLISFTDQTDPSLIDTFDPQNHRALPVGQLSELLNTIRAFACPYVIMAGRIDNQLLFKGMNPDPKMLNLLENLKCQNAETIFGAFVQEIENNGNTVLDARSFLDQHLAEEGLMTEGHIEILPEHIDYGIRTAKKIADLNIGQGIVTRKNTVLAVEAYEGTNQMLHRVRNFKTDQLVFFKTIKENQDHRFDVPVFGMTTLELMIESNIHTAVLEKHSVILVDKEKIITKAREHKVQLIGFDPKSYN